MLSCVPASFELLGYVLFAPMILGVNRIEAAVLRHCLSAKGNRAGSHWLGTDGYGTSVRSDRIICGSYGHSNHGSAGGAGDGQYV